MTKQNTETKATQTIQIRYIGSGHRVIDEYVWNDDNEFVCAVDIKTFANLITYYSRTGQFEAVAEQAPSTEIKKKLVKLLNVKLAEVNALFENATSTNEVDLENGGETAVVEADNGE